MEQVKRWLAAWTPRRTLFVAVVTTVLVLDQVTKFWAVGALTHAFEPPTGGTVALSEQIDRYLWRKHPQDAAPVVVVDDFWRFEYAENPGAAWSLLAAMPDWFR